ncbi:MAG TPA: hypothetical protein VF331_04625 [Polyangiales bacterium]
MSGCLVTDPVTFKDEVNVPPVIIGDRKIPVGSIIKVDVTAAGPNELRIPVTIRDENVGQELFERTLVTKSNGYVFYTCPEPSIPPSGSVNRSDFQIVINKTDLNPGECHRVDFVVSSRFTHCENAVSDGGPLDNEQVATVVGLFDQASDFTDIARARYWIWEVSGGALSNPQAAQALAESCKVIDATHPSSTVP